MPHLTLEYTDNLSAVDPARLLAAVNAAMLDSGLFDEADIKSRACPLAHFRVGLEARLRAFVHVRIGLLAGRSPQARQMLGERVLAALQATVAAPAGGELQLSVETVDIDRASYAKAVCHG